MMDVVILCGGKGTRLYPLSRSVPKPMVPIGERPVVDLIMRHLRRFGLSRFVLCLGHQGEVIRRHFTSPPAVREQADAGYSVLCVDTGSDTMTGGRLARVAPYVSTDRLLVAYGDVLSDIDARALMDHHARLRPVGTVTAVQRRSPFGHLQLDGDAVRTFAEKPVLRDWVSIGNVVLDRPALRLLEPDAPSLESGLLPDLAERGELNVFRHRGRFEPMDTVADHRRITQLWESGDLDWVS